MRRGRHAFCQRCASVSATEAMLPEGSLASFHPFIPAAMDQHLNRVSRFNDANNPIPSVDCSGLVPQQNELNVRGGTRIGCVCRQRVAPKKSASVTQSRSNRWSPPESVLP
jgi:hypothetical protein